MVRAQLRVHVRKPRHGVTRLNFNKEAIRRRMWQLIVDAYVYLDSYRPGAISKFGFSDAAPVAANPQLIICRLRCDGTSGPWLLRGAGHPELRSAAAVRRALCRRRVARVPEFNGYGYDHCQALQEQPVD